MLINQASKMDDTRNEEGNAQLECRACLMLVTKGFYNIFQPWNAPWVGMQSTAADDLAKIANIDLSESDPHSKVMCNKCCIQLHNACRFISTVQRSDNILRLRCVYEVPVEMGVSSWPKPIQLEKNINGCVLTTAMDIEVKQEVVSDAECDTNGADEGFRPDLDVNIKVEPEEVQTHPPIKVTVNGTISMDEMGSHNLVIDNGCAIYEDEEYLDAKVKEEVMSEDDEQVPLDLPPECMLCSKIFYSVSGLKAHVISQHSYKSVKRKVGNSKSPEKKPTRYICGTCRRSFVTSTDLMVHETCHNKSVCYSCNEKFDTFDQLTKHRIRCKAILNKEVSKPKMLEDVIRYIPPTIKIRPVKESTLKKDTQKCSLCSEEFSDSYYMNIHHEIHHTSAQTVHGDKVHKSVLGQNDKTKKTVTETKIETENLQKMFEQTEIGTRKGNGKEIEDSNRLEIKIEQTEKDQMKELNCNMKKEEGKNADKCDRKKNNEPIEQNGQDDIKHISEHRDETILSVKSDQKENKVEMEESVGAEITHGTEHRECGEQIEKFVKKGNNEIKKDNMHNIEHKNENEQENKSKENKHAVKSGENISIQKQYKGSDQETNVEAVNKQTEKSISIQKQCKESEQEENKHTEKSINIQKQCEESKQEETIVQAVDEQTEKSISIQEQCKKSEQKETNVEAVNEQTEKSQGKQLLQVDNDEMETETIEIISREK